MQRSGVQVTPVAYPHSIEKFKKNSIFVKCMAWDIEKIIQEMEHCFLAHEIVELEQIQPFAQFLMDHPDEAIGKISTVYHRGLNEVYTNKEGKNERAFIESIAGGPFEGIPWALYNAVGAVYPYLAREQKDHVLKQLLSIWDGINCGYVNGERSTGHTTGIREPLLHADVYLCRRVYWPGFADYESFVKKYQSFEELKTDLMDKEGVFNPKKVQSDFLLACYLLRSDHYDEHEAYAQAAHPAFLERTIHALVNMRFGRTTTDEEVQQGNARLREVLTPSLHDSIDKYRQQADWVDVKKFR